MSNETFTWKVQSEMEWSWLLSKDNIWANAAALIIPLLIVFIGEKCQHFSKLMDFPSLGSCSTLSFPVRFRGLIHIYDNRRNKEFFVSRFSKRKLRQIITPSRMTACSSLPSQVKYSLSQAHSEQDFNQFRAQQHFLGWQWWLKSWNNRWLCWKWPFPFSREVIKSPLAITSRSLF